MTEAIRKENSAATPRETTRNKAEGLSLPLGHVPRARFKGLQIG